MATPIPAFVSQWFPPTTADAYIYDNNGTYETVSTAIWYYLVSNRTTSANGKSLLREIKTQLDASSLSTTAAIWTVSLTSTFPQKVTFSHTAPGALTIQASAALAFATGMTTPAEYALGDGAQFDVGGGTTPATYASPYLWSPGMPISMTGPQLFDPALNYGIPTSAGAVQRAPDMTAAAVSNGVQWAAEYRFNGMDGYYLARANSGAHVNEDFETWWQNGPALGRRLLMWRDRTVLTSSAPSAGSFSPYNYIEYFPADELRGQLLATPMVPPNLNFWDIRVPLLVTENGESVLTV